MPGSTHFTLGDVDLGLGYLGAGNPPALQEIPMTLATIPGKFLTKGDITYTFIDNYINVSIPINPGDLTQTQHFSMVGIKDMDNELVAAAVAQPYYLHPTTSKPLVVRLRLPFAL